MNKRVESLKQAIGSNNEEIEEFKRLNFKHSAEIKEIETLEGDLSGKILIHEGAEDENCINADNVRKFIKESKEEDEKAYNFIKKILLDNKRDWIVRGEVISLILSELDIATKNKDKLAGDKLI